jgi:hypothetical protein
MSGAVRTVRTDDCPDAASQSLAVHTAAVAAPMVPTSKSDEPSVPWDAAVWHRRF